MTRKNYQILLLNLKLFDQFIVIFSLLTALFVTSKQIQLTSINQFLTLKVNLLDIAFFLLFLLTWYIILNSFGLYHLKSKCSCNHWLKTSKFIIVNSLGTLVLGLLAYIFKIEIVTLKFLSFFWFCNNTNTILSRLILGYILKFLNCRNIRHILFVGTNRRALNFAREVESNEEMRYRIVGFVDIKWNKINDFQRSGYSLVADIQEMPSFLEQNVVDEVIICLPIKSFYNEIVWIIKLCEEQGIVLRFIPSFFNSKLSQSQIEQFEDKRVITLYREIPYWHILIKRVLDISVSLILLPILSPLFLIVAILIKVTSRGPVIFVQERIGLNKRKFNLYKFRTMTMNAHEKQCELLHLNEVSGPVFKIRNDPRITPIGKILRKSSIDELPQLYNVLKGDMSLVGPRPPLPNEVKKYRWEYRIRLSVKPGITCLWQISGRNNVSFDKWMELDKQYIDNWSLWLDLKILAKTIPVVISGKGAA